MDKKEKVKFLNETSVYDMVKVTYEPRFLFIRGRATTIEGVVGALGLDSVKVVLPGGYLDPRSECKFDRDHVLGIPQRVPYSQILDYEIVGNFIKEFYPELLQESE